MTMTMHVSHRHSDEIARLQRELADTRAERDEARRLHGKHILDASRQLTEANAALVAMTSYRDGAVKISKDLEAEVQELRAYRDSQEIIIARRDTEIERLRSNLCDSYLEVARLKSDLEQARGGAAEQHGREEGK